MAKSKENVSEIVETEGYTPEQVSEARKIVAWADGKVAEQVEAKVIQDKLDNTNNYHNALDKIREFIRVKKHSNPGQIAREFQIDIRTVENLLRVIQKEDQVARNARVLEIPAIPKI